MVKRTTSETIIKYRLPTGEEAEIEITGRVSTVKKAKDLVLKFTGQEAEILSITSHPVAYIMTDFDFFRNATKTNI